MKSVCYTTQIFKVPAFMIILKTIGENKGCTLSDISKITTITYSHVCIVRKALFEKQLISVVPKGRCVFIYLTAKGENVTRAIVNMLDELKINDNNIDDYALRSKQFIKKDYNYGEEVNGE